MNVHANCHLLPSSLKDSWVLRQHEAHPGFPTRAPNPAQVPQPHDILLLWSGHTGNTKEHTLPFKSPKLKCSVATE